MNNRKRIFIKLFILLTFFLTLILVFSCHKKRSDIYNDDISLAKIYLKEKLSIGLSIPFPPMADYDSNGNLVGYDIDVLTEVCNRLEVKPDFIIIDWSEKLDLLKSEQIDVLASGFGLTPERVGVYLMTRPLVQNAQVLVVRSDSTNINSMKDLQGKFIGAQTGSTGEAIIADLMDKGFKCKLQTYSQIEIEISELKNRKLDALIIDLLVINSYIHEEKLDFRILNEALEDEKYVFAFRLGDKALKEEVEKILLEMARDGYLEMLTRKWFYANISLIR
ncbi:MAG: hypothetical protein CR988_06800 [Treponema sp.]|nr:MAG: hypothetical protein CR988_06800 [Treponema sp.]